MNYLFLTLKILLGAFFIFSGFAKLYPIEPFEYLFVEKGISSWVIAAFVARTIIAFEIAIGILLIFSQKSKLVLYATLAMLLAFTIYLLVELFVLGNNNDCGCFGSWISLTNKESILKNVILLVITGLLIRFDKHDITRIFAYPLLILASLITPFILNPVILSHQYTYDPKTNKTIDFNKFSEVDNKGNEFDVKTGVKVVAFFSTTCKHCKIAARKLNVMSKKMQLPPVKVYFLGGEQGVKTFQQEINSDFSYVRTLDENMFYKQADYVIPCIYLLKDGKVINRWYEFYVIEEYFEKNKFN